MSGALETIKYSCQSPLCVEFANISCRIGPSAFSLSIIWCPKRGRGFPSHRPILRWALGEPPVGGENDPRPKNRRARASWSAAHRAQLKCTAIRGSNCTHACPFATLARSRNPVPLRTTAGHAVGRRSWRSVLVPPPLPLPAPLLRSHLCSPSSLLGNSPVD